MAEETTNSPSQAQIEWLQRNPHRYEEFDSRFGAGTSANYVEPLERDGALTDTGKGFIEGILGTIRETGQFIGEIAQGSNLNPADPAHYGLERTPENRQALEARDGNIAARGEAMQDAISKITIFGEERDTGLGSVTQGITQFVAGMIGVGKLTKLKAFTTVRGGLVAGAAVDGVMFDPDDANLVKMLDEQFGIGNELVTDILANDEDTNWENRLKNAMTGGAIGLAVDLPIMSLKWLKAKKKARVELETNGKISDETLAEVSQLEKQVQNFSELEARPSGAFRPDGMFETTDGMVFNPQTGGRMLDLEVSKTVDEAVDLAEPQRLETPEVDDAVAPVRSPEPEAQTASPELGTPPAAAADEGRMSLYADELDPNKIDQTPPAKPEAGEVPTTPNVVTEAPTPAAVVKPKSVVNVKALSTAVKAARKLNEGQIVQIGDLNQMGDNVGLFNYTKMDGPLEAVKVMDGIQDALLSSGALAKKGLQNKQAHTEVVQLAQKELESLVDDPLAVRANYRALADAGQETASRIVAGKMALQSTGRRIDQLLDELDLLAANKNTDTAVERQLVDMLDLHADLQLSVKGMQTAAARATAAGRIRTADAIGDATLDRLAQFGGSAKVQKLAAQLRATKGNKKAAAKVIREANKRTWIGVVNEVWLNAILSGIRTHVMNIGSNSINMAMRPAQRMVGGFVQRDMAVVEKGAREYFYLGSEIFDSIAYLATASKYGKESALHNAFRSWWREDGVLDTASKFDFNQSGNGRMIGGLGGKILRGPGRTLQAEDEFFKQLIFRSRLKANVMVTSRKLTDEQLGEMGYLSREAYIEDTLKNALLNKEALASKWDEMVAYGKVADDPETRAKFIEENIGTYNHSSKMAQEALVQAREATFTTPLRDGTLGKTVQDSINKHPILRQVMPFIQTPTNILRVSFERVPILGVYAGQQRKILREGTPDEKAMVYGQQAVGFTFAAGAIWMAYNGRITGGGPSYNKDLNKAKLWNASPDWMPYSVNVGSSENPNWIELKKLDPHGMIFGIAGDVVEMLEFGRENPDPEIMDIIAMLGVSVANNVMSKTYLSSLSDTMNLFNGAASPFELQQFAENRAASMVPYSGLAYQLNQAGDDHMRDLREFTDKVKSRVFGMNNAPVKHDWLTGEAVDTPEYMMSFIRQKKMDSGEHRAAAVFEELRNIGHGFTGPQRSIEGMELPSEVFQKYNELVGTIKISGYGTLLDAMEKKMGTREYKQASEGAEANPIDTANDPRVILLNGVINGYKKQARLELYKLYPKLEQDVTNNKKINFSLKRGGDRSQSEGLIRKFTLD